MMRNNKNFNQSLSGAQFSIIKKIIDYFLKKLFRSKVYIIKKEY